MSTIDNLNELAAVQEWAIDKTGTTTLRARYAFPRTGATHDTASDDSP